MIVSVDTEDERQSGSKSYNLRVRCPKTIHYEAPAIGQFLNHSHVHIHTVLIVFFLVNLNYFACNMLLVFYFK